MPHFVLALEKEPMVINELDEGGLEDRAKTGPAVPERPV